MSGRRKTPVAAAERRRARGHPTERYSGGVTKQDKSDALAELYKAIPRGWIVGRPPFDAAASKWRLFAYERRARGSSIATVSAEAETEHDAVREMARKLRTTAASRRSPSARRGR